MNRQSSHLSIFAIGVWFVLCGCISFGPNDPPAPSPVEYEGCSNDHDEFWLPADTGVEVIDGEGALADQSCNKMRFHSGGGGQGGDTFHLEPGLHFVGPDRDVGELSVTWDMYDLEGNHVTGQGFEVYEYELVDVEDGRQYWSPQLFIGAADRGKNVRLVATMVLPTEDGNEEVVAEAAFYLVEVIAPDEGTP